MPTLGSLTATATSVRPSLECIAKVAGSWTREKGMFLTSAIA